MLDQQGIREACAPIALPLSVCPFQFQFSVQSTQREKGTGQWPVSHMTMITNLQIRISTLMFDFPNFFCLEVSV